MKKLKILIFDMEIEDGDLTPCLSVSYVSCEKGKKYYKNPESNECNLFFPGEEPKGWVLGRYTPWRSKNKEENK